MQKLKIFISSTCLDKQEQRSVLGRYIEDELGHEAILSDLDGVFYDPREHTHTSCVREVDEADVLILLIGNRFGGECHSEARNLLDFEHVGLMSKKSDIFKKGSRISITQAEALRAFQKNIPVFTIVDQITFDRRLQYNSAVNSGKNLTQVLETIVPDKKERRNAESIFGFIGYISNREKNNGIKTIETSSIQKIQDYMSSNLSALFKSSLSYYLSAESEDFGLKNRIIRGDAEYLRLLAELISESEKEVFFTSTHMASTQDGDTTYREGQKKIIEASKEFKDRNESRLHYGIIESGPDTSFGATELRKNIPDLSLRFNSRLTSRHANFFVSDSRKVVLRMNLDRGGEKYAILIENRNFAKILKQYFFSIWDTSELMKTRIENVMLDEEHANLILEIAEIKDKSELNLLLEELHKLDELSLEEPSDNKIIRPQASKFGGKRSDHAFDLYEQYLKNIDLKKTLYRSNIAKIKSKISRNASINYDKYSDVFFFQFFLANYYKTRHALEQLDTLSNWKEGISILDVGGGGGSSSLALADHFQENNTPEFKLKILDRSKKQLEVTKNILEGRDLTETYIEQDAYKFLSETNEKFDLIIAANFMCEAYSQNPSICLPSLFKQRLLPNGILIVVERLESEIYEEIENSKLFTCKEFFRQNKRYSLPAKKRAFLYVIDHELGYELSPYLKTSYSVRYGIYE